MAINFNEERKRIRHFAHGVVSVLINGVQDKSILVKGTTKRVVILDVKLRDVNDVELETSVMIFQNYDEDSPYATLLSSSGAASSDDLAGMLLTAQSYKSGAFVNLTDFERMTQAPDYTGGPFDI